MTKPSPIEVAFWENAKPKIPELEREIWIGKYRVDFIIPSKKIIIELYGYEYHNSKKKITNDAKRERELQRMGYQIIRFTGTEIFKDVKKCVNEVMVLGKITETQPKAEQPKINYAEKKIENKGLNRKQKAIITSMTITTLCLMSILLTAIAKTILSK